MGRPPSLTARLLLYRSDQVRKASPHLPPLPLVKRNVNRSKANSHDRQHHQVVRQYKPSFFVGNVGSENTFLGWTKKAQGSTLGANKVVAY
jgi:hypothetical protein